MPAIKAVIFTHFPFKIEQKAFDARTAQKIFRRILPYLKAYLLCRNIGLVYIYVDTGIQLTLQHLSRKKGKLLFPIDALEFEYNTRNCLKLAVDNAINDLKREPGLNYDRSLSPRFQIIGLPHMLSLIHSLYQIDPSLIQDGCIPD